MFTDNIQAIPLPTLADVNQDFSGMTGTITGYGKTTDGELCLGLRYTGLDSVQQRLTALGSVRERSAGLGSAWERSAGFGSERGVRRSCAVACYLEQSRATLRNRAELKPRQLHCIAWS
jgi:hypothetical protein